MNKQHNLVNSYGLLTAGLFIVFNFQLSFFNCANAQMKIVGKNSDGTLQSITPYVSHSSAVLELESTTKGFLLPRLTTKARDTINPAPATGLMIFNTDTKCVDFYNGSGWTSLCNSTFDIQPVCGGDSLIDIRNGVRDVYSIKAYGPAGCWMTQNLRYFDTTTGNIYGMRINPGYYGTYNAIPVTHLDSIHATTTVTNIKYYEDKDTIVTREEFTKKFGLMYSWVSTTMLGTTEEGARGICPNGWHVPTSTEWIMLEKTIATTSTYGGTPGSWQTVWEGRATDASVGSHGILMKADAKIYGQYGGVNLTAWSTGTKINASGFNAYPSGMVGIGNKSEFFAAYAAWWSSTKLADGRPVRFVLSTGNGTTVNGHPDNRLFSVRCKKN